MTPSVFLRLLPAVFLLTACAQREDPGVAGSATPIFDGEAIEAHVRLLADDLYEGREAGSRGYGLAARYVATQFRLLGIGPGNGDSYFQSVPFAVASVVPGSRRLSLEKDGRSIDLELDTHFTSTARLGDEEVTITAPLVFVGYGVNAPMIERDDYADVDLDGKIAVVVRGAPAALGSEKRAFFASGRYHKSIELEKHGAIAAIGMQHKLIASEGATIRGAKTDKFWWSDEHDHPQHAFESIEISAALLDKGARELFANAPLSFDEMVASIEDGSYRSFELGINATISQKQRHSRSSSPNVMGLLRGSDPTVAHEVIVLSGHLDGVGLGFSGDDRIYNGFYDNASGIGVMLEVARALASSATPPRRSILFLATTGEEKGLLGADFFARNPVVPIENIVANVNMDMAMFLWPVQDVIAFGAQHSDLQSVVASAAQAAGVDLSPDPFPERSYFTRSDQFPFVQQGVPAVFLATGFSTNEAGTDPRALYDDFMKRHYHGATDDGTLRFDTDSAAIVAEVNYRIATSIANAESRPLWVPNSFFGELYGTAATLPARSD